jgi:enediyne biosynthesis protein E4
MKAAFVAPLLVPFFFACTTKPSGEKPAASEQSNAIFVDRAEETGLSFHHFIGATGQYYVAEINSSGIALFDFDNDGDLDVFCAQGKVLEKGKSDAEALFPLQHESANDRLFRNELVPTGTLRFVDVTAASGIVEHEHGQGVATGDFDNDGLIDLYVVNYERNRLWRNLGGGKFVDATVSAGVDEPRWTGTATFFDFDRDGWLDLFAGNYLEAPLDAVIVCNTTVGTRDYCGPGRYPPAADRLWRNRGGGRFEVAATSVPGANDGPAMGSVGADFDGDGWSDLYVANDSSENQLWLNQKDGRLRDEAMVLGVAVNGLGQTEASMGLAAEDLDGDLDFDLFATNFIAETNTFYRNDGAANFVDATAMSGLGPPSRPFTSFGVAAIDYDNDADFDLYVANGGAIAVEELARQRDPFPYHQRNQLFRNRGNGSFEDVSGVSGPSFELSETSRAVAMGDLDNDGDADLVVGNNNGRLRLLINVVGQESPWLGLRLMDESGRFDVLGAMVLVKRKNAAAILRRVHTDGSYASAHDPRLLVGLGTAAELEKLEIIWPDGRREFFAGLELRRYHVLRRGSGSSGVS